MEHGYQYDDRMAVRRGSGWLAFAAMMLALAGTFSVINGIIAVAKARFYTPDAVYVFSDLRTWGWILIVLGCLQIGAASSIGAGRSFGRWFGIAAASLNALGQLFFVPAYPIWAVAIFAVDVLIIYGLTAYGGHQDAV